MCEMCALLPHSATDSPDLAIAYDVNIRAKLSNIAMVLAPEIDYTDLLSGAKYDIIRDFVANLSSAGKGKDMGEGPNG